MEEWTEYTASDPQSYISIEQWGHDHWSTFAYLETRAVDGHGYIDNRRMRCSPRLHREFAHSADGSEYPTRLKEGEQPQHDDWSCLEDMAAAGLLRASWRVIKHDEIFGTSQARVELTDQGKAIAEQLRRWKMDGGRYAAFVPSVPPSDGREGNHG